MADDEYEMAWDEDEDDQQMGEDVDENDPVVMIQNNFYEGESLVKENPKAALGNFTQVVELEDSSGKFEYTFNSIKYIIVLSMQLGGADNYKTMSAKTRLLLNLAAKVSRNDMTEAINAIQDQIETSLSDKPDQAKEMYQLILGNLKQTNERLWFNTSLRLGKIYLDSNAIDMLEQVISELKMTCRLPDTDPSRNNADCFDKRKGQLLLEILALEIQMCIQTKESRRMKDAFMLSNDFTSTVEDPRVVGIIKECGGKMYMSEKRWELARQQFIASFESLVECGSGRAPTLLKYVILASMLCNSDVDYLTQREAQIYKDDPIVAAMTTLKEGYERNNIERIQTVLKDKKVNILSDPFMELYLADLLRSTRLKATEAICKPYKSIRLDFLSKQLDVPLDEVRSLLAELILEERLKGQIDQIKGILELSPSELKLNEKHRALQQWSKLMLDVHGKLMAKVSDPSGGGREMGYSNYRM